MKAHRGHEGKGSRGEVSGRQGRELLKDHRLAEFSKPQACISHRTILDLGKETKFQIGGAPRGDRVAH